jgi:hypothetical protein
MHCDPGVGAENVDPAALRLDSLDQLPHVLLVGHVASHRFAADLLSDRRCPVEVDVGNDHDLGSGARKPLGKGATYPLGASSHDNHSAGYVHLAPLSQTENFCIRKFLVENRMRVLSKTSDSA